MTPEQAAVAWCERSYGAYHDDRKCCDRCSWAESVIEFDRAMRSMQEPCIDEARKQLETESFYWFTRDKVAKLIELCDYHEALLHDMKLESTAYQRGVVDGEANFLAKAKMIGMCNTNLDTTHFSSLLQTLNTRVD